MNMSLSQSPQLQLKATMTPELQQSVRILQLTGMDLVSYLQEQVMDNPLLELEREAWVRGSRRVHSYRELSEDPLFRLPARTETLEQSLLAQLRWTGIDEPCYKIAAFIVGSLDKSGYLTMTVPEIAELIHKSEQEVLSALLEVQKLEPAGIGARDLRECLLLQISKDPAAPFGVYELVEEWFSLIAHGKWEDISRVSGMTLEQLKRSAGYIQSLQPRPGYDYGYEDEQPQYAVPEAEVGWVQGELVILWNQAMTPRLSLSSDMDGLSFSSKEAAAYVKAKKKEGQWLIRSLEQRYKTLKRVIKAILEEQPCFRELGALGLKPLKLRTIAEKLQLHESTISRAVSGKYIRTPHGTLELKFFFSAIQLNGDDESSSSLYIKSHIGELIANENKLKPLSDQKIVDELMKLGVKVARRTVTKYREELHIVSSALRKKRV
ncbi:RNA polymerase factor sigma-54 [Paenibacillus sp. UNC451MF]|uniref:RNA polymerase factor sigma-54 n=1 Tax=Paenibacillus sp. UNC451MF TaxID=1449063 RepID=UPI00048C2F03|nr:RNA polymerase factor sigma-54 [Paenibacillus sp. UNC451MF]